jgi:hypothetical protein
MPRKKGLSKSYSRTLRLADDMDRIAAPQQKLKIVNAVTRVSRLAQRECPGLIRRLKLVPEGRSPYATPA